MEFTDAAEFFNDDEVFDAYTDEFLFMAHTTPHDDHTSSGSTSRRRTMITAVSVAPPARRAIRWYDTCWIVGGNNTDAFQGGEVRRSFGMKKSTGLATALTLAQACLGVPGTGVPFHAHREYYRDMTDAQTSSDYDVMYNVHFSPSEPVVKGSILEQGGRYMFVRNLYESADEFAVAEADTFDADARQLVTFLGSPGLDFGTAGATGSTTTYALQTDSSKVFVFRAMAEGTNQAGDRTVFVARSAVTPKVGDRFTMQGFTWRVVICAPVGDAWAIRGRLA